ncbi:putative membrane protein [Rubidibacter lacunae KORDI 51-2]|uniref:Putative membrane protein n=1 Tax=Rubidibacter lacunae KORDI 51-2 TaxID=582515 RepID=U5DNJ6_9CHRO|nr:DoxX family protein [Rubidibacter lacunae]ERN41280.1 putative membrane protein [Rubidibacter lacunae KORDI 51-2]
MNMKSAIDLLTLVLRPTLSASYISQIGWTVLRLTVGLMMIHNGLDKLSDIENFAAAYVEAIGLPFPIVFSYVAAFTELLAAPLVAVGLLTRPAAFGLFSTMCVAMYHHVKVAGFSIPYLELSAVYAACFLFFAINGAGIFSLDALIGGWLISLSGRQDESKRAALESTYQSVPANLGSK